MELIVVIAVIAAIYCLVQWGKEKNQAATNEKAHRAAQKRVEALLQEAADLKKAQMQSQEQFAAVEERLQDEIASLTPYKEVRDTVGEAARIREAARLDAESMRRESNEEAKLRRERAEALLENANTQASQIIKDANRRAEDIAGDAYRALKDAEALKEVASAMRNVIEGYGDKYLKPSYSLLDQLAEDYGFEQAGQELKQARERSKLMIEHGRAASCDYVDLGRRATAIRFVEDAFNGKVDSILSRAKSDNFGTLERQIRDAFALVNNNASAFRNAKITEEYLLARLDELKWAAAVHALRERDREEQRRIREQMREEEKGRKEIERALKEAARDEEVLQKAMEKLQGQAAKANEAQRVEFELKLIELQAKLAEAEARGQRALSMAQQTKAGHVYVISNIGSFGEDVYKVGMTRRLEPLDRIKELGDASVPFEFDVHALIWSDDAPGLENALHKRFLQSQVNKVNPRKEFFRLSLGNLKKEVEAMGIDSTWTLTAHAAEYRESLAIEKQIRDNPENAREWLEHQLDQAALPEVLVSAEDA